MLVWFVLLSSVEPGLTPGVSVVCVALSSVAPELTSVDGEVCIAHPSVAPEITPLVRFLLLSL